MILRLTDKQLIIMQKGRRDQPELTASLYPDSNSFYVVRYGVPDIKDPAILFEVKGYGNSPDAKYLFYCKENEQLYEQLQKKITEASKRISYGTLRHTPVSTPTPTTPGPHQSLNDPLAMPSFNHTHLQQPATTGYVNTEERPQMPHTPRNNSSFGGSRYNTPLSPVPEDEMRLLEHGKFVLDMPPLTRAELQKRRTASTKVTLPNTFEPNWPGMPHLRYGSNPLFGDVNREAIASRTSLSTRSSGLLNQLSARSDCEPLLMSNVSTPNPNQMRLKHNSSDPIYVHPSQPDEFTAPRTPAFNCFTAPPQSGKRFVFPPMDELKRPEGSSMNYVTVEHNSMSSSNSTPRTPKTPGPSVQYTPVDFQKTEELHRSQSITRADSTRSRSTLISQK